jgi:hypothetical protein
MNRSRALVRSALAALALASSLATPARADDLGRLFFTPQERQDLDRRRAAGAAAEQRADESPAQSLVTLNGQVTRSGGKTTTWVNGVPHDDTYRSRDPARAAVQGRSLKVGETLDRSRGSVTDPLQGGEIRINRAPAK